MQIPPIIELEEAAKRLVWDATKKGTLKELTPRLVRQTIETQFGLEEGSLDASEYKSAIKSATKSALNQDPPPSEEEETRKPPAKVNKRRKSDDKHEEDDQPTPKSKGKSSATASKNREDEGSAKKKRKTVKAKEIESEDKGEGNSDSEEAPPTTTKKKGQKRKDTKQFKSFEHVPTSDMEQDEPDIISIAGPSITKDVNPKEKKGSHVGKKTVPSKPSEGAQNPESKPANNPQSDVVMGDTVGRDTSSELSELDEPKPKQMSKAVNKEPKKTKTKEKEKEKKSAKSSTTLNKDEETIKRLKSLVLACGVRKVWSKVFRELDSPHQQIKKLKEILADLGMTGRMSVEQAKMIKQKRELAQELEDVQQFEKAVLGKRSQTSAKGTPIEQDDSEKDKGSDSGEEDGVGPAPKRRPANARKSIMAFLQDQSDEE